MKKILTIIGARPQFIKAVIVSKELQANYDEVLLHTGQHYDDNMSAIFFRELGLREPNFNLGVGGGTQAEQTAAMLIGIEKAIQSVIPDLILVYGDTNSTLAGALAGAKCHIPVAHVEAGLRSFNRTMPEEVNRVMTDHLSSILFCPTNQSVHNLSAEGITKQVYKVGDVMFDVFNQMSDFAMKHGPPLDGLYSLPAKFSLLTLHRAENTDNLTRLSAILGAVNELKTKVIFPVHPRTEIAIKRIAWKPAAHVTLVPPVGYLEMVRLEKLAECILTDSGGIQKEAFWAGTRCITLRKETEWVETVDIGWNVLVDADKDAIIDRYTSFHPTGTRPPVYGDGKASVQIVHQLDILIKK